MYSILFPIDIFFSIKEMICSLLFAFIFVSSAQSSCPDLPSLRSSFVLNSFNVSKISGLWYEIAFQDLAQVGATCQVLINDVPSNATRRSDGFAQQFKVLYPPSLVPFILNSVYTPVAANVTNNTVALYDRTFAGINLTSSVRGGFVLPSVIVDLRLDPTSGEYVAMTDYMCLSFLGLDYIEVRFMFRSMAPDPADVAALIACATALGLKWDKITYNDFSKCPPQ